MTFVEIMDAITEATPELSTELAAKNLREAREEFLQNGAEGVPNFVYDDASYAENKQTVNRLLRQARAEDFPAVQMEVLTAAADRALQTIVLLEEIREYRKSGAETPAEIIRRLTTELWGMPDLQTYHELLKRRLLEMQRNFEILKQAEMLTALDRQRFEKIFRLLEGELATNATDVAQTDKAGDAEAVFEPKPTTVRRFEEFYRQRMQKSLERIGILRVYDADEVCDLINAILQEDLPYKTKWQAVVDEKKGAICANQQQRTLEIPRHRSKGPYTGEVVRDILVGHELVHVLRRAYAEAHCPEVMLLPNYLEFDEGLAKAVEQSLGGSFKQSGIEHYLTISMAVHDGRNFADLFAFNRMQQILRNVTAQDAPQEYAKKLQAADVEAFRLTERCLRGTSILPLTKDLVYYNGQMRAWQYIEERIDQPEKLEKMLFCSGKSDPTDPLHQKMLLSLGWTEADFIA